MMPGTPMARIEPVCSNPEPEKARITAEALNAYLSKCYRILRNSTVNKERVARGLQPANFLATQRCGKRILQEPFDRKWGMRGMLIASGAMYKGLALELGLTFVKMRDSDNPGKDLRERIRLALDDREHDFVHVHTKVPDDTAHMGGPDVKREAIASLDEGLDEITRIADKQQDFVLAVTADHSTSSIPVPAIHSGEPVPVTIVGPRVRRDDVCVFDEIQAAKGCLGFLRGEELLLTLLNYADRAVLVGHQLGGTVRPYFPRDYIPYVPES
jgi:2,3-bisphosphoglycerate-independent phosphoglycerate mutase